MKTISRFGAAALLFAMVLTAARLSPGAPGPGSGNTPGLADSPAVFIIDAGRSLGPLPPLQGILSQGTEAADPMFYAEMEAELAALRPVLLRVDPAAAVGFALSATGALQLDFTRADAIMASLRRTGTALCWNSATWPKDWKRSNGYPADLAHWEEFNRRFVARYNTGEDRPFRYVEFWNEPDSFNRRTYEAMARGAKRGDPRVKVGGPAVLDLKMSAIRDLLQARQEGVPADFVSYHLYHRAPWDYPRDARTVLDALAAVPGAADLECLVTEWGVDMGESGSCDSRYNAVYTLTSLLYWMPLYPQVLPCFFEVRDGWDGKGPSRELWGRWGMLTYPHRLKKPVYHAAWMWARMAGEQVAVGIGGGRGGYGGSDHGDGEYGDGDYGKDDYDYDYDPDPDPDTDTDTDIRGDMDIEYDTDGRGIYVIASRDETQLTVLVWSFPREHARAEPGDPVHGPSRLDTPFHLVIANLPFDSGGLRIERYVLDEERSNINHHLSHNALEKVQDQVVPRGPSAEPVTLSGMLGMHSAQLWVLRPAQPPPVRVAAVAERPHLWAGESAELIIRPLDGEDYPLTYQADPAGDPDWEVAVLANAPLTLRVTPRRVRSAARQYFSGWVKRPDWGAEGQIFMELRVTLPVKIVEIPWRVDALPPDPALLPIGVRNIQGSEAQASIAFTEWPEWSATKTLPASATSVTAFVLPPLPPEPGRRELHGTLRINGLAARDFTLRIDTPLDAVRLEAPPVIDGDLREWERLPAHRLTGRENWSGRPGSRWDGPDDLEATVRAGWDPSNLYFALEIRDATPIARETNNRMHLWDSVHFGFDLRRDATDPSLYYGGDDCEYLFNVTESANAYRQWGAGRPEGVPESVRVAAQRHGDRTLYEIAFPWEAEFAPFAGPVPGTLMGFSLAIRDFDGDPGETEAGTLMFGRGLDWHLKRPALFGSLRLAD